MSKITRVMIIKPWNIRNTTAWMIVTLGILTIVLIATVGK